MRLTVLGLSILKTNCFCQVKDCGKYSGIEVKDNVSHNYL